MRKIIFFLFSFFYCLNAEIVTGEKIAYPVESKNLFEERIVRVTVTVKDGKIKSKDFHEPYNFRFREEIEKKIKDWKYSEDGVYNIEVDFRIIKTRCNYYKVKRKKWILFTENTEIKSCVSNKLNEYFIYEKREEVLYKGIFLIEITIVIEDDRAQK